MNQLLPPGQWFGEKPISVMFKNGKSVVRKLALARFGPPSTDQSSIDSSISNREKLNQEGVS